MSNTIFIKEVNNQPVIFNVDNATDIARLEALQAVKMSDNLVRSVFGENSMYADNTTCTITENPDNAEFPFTVQFDSSKIPAKPKRELGTMAGLGMPSDKYIDYISALGTSTSILKIFTAPANGYFALNALTTQANGFANMSLTTTANVSDIDDSKKIMSITSTYGVISGGTGCFLPIYKGQRVLVHIANSRVKIFKFHYAQGEI